LDLGPRRGRSRCVRPRALRAFLNRQLNGAFTADEAIVNDATIEIVRGLAMNFVGAAAVAVAVLLLSVVAAYVVIYGA
jgi:hypothetical protein